MDELENLRDSLDRLQALLEDLIVRGLRSVGSGEVKRLTAIRDEFRTAGAEHLAGKLTPLIASLGDTKRETATQLYRAMTALRLFDRMLTLEVADELLTVGE